MRKWLRRFVYFIIIVVWASVFAFPVVAFNLARNGELNVRNTRIFLISEQTEGGVGFQSTRDVGQDANCKMTSVVYLLWEGEGENVRSCYCEDGIEREPLRNQCVEP